MSRESTIPAVLPGERFGFLDVLRGFALCGILPVNIAWMAMPVMTGDGLTQLATGADRIALEFREGFFTFRFVTLFSFLFGIGIALLGAKCDRAGLASRTVLGRRFLALLGFGVLHVALLWYGDILITYAVLGLAIVMLGLDRLSSRTLVTFGVFAFALPALLLFAVSASEWLSVATYTPEIPEPLSREEARSIAHGSWGALLETWWYLDPNLETAIVLEGSFIRQVLWRTLVWIYNSIISCLFFTPRAFAMMCFGIVAARAGHVLDPLGGRAWFRRRCIEGLGIGIPLQGVATFVGTAIGSAQAIAFATALQFVASLAMALGYLGALGIAVGALQRRAGLGGGEVPRVLRPLAALGRMAFTQYLMHSFLAACLFHAWGLGWFGRFGLVELWGVVFAFWVFGLVTSTLWLGRFRQGPLEALWRRLTYGRRASVVKSR